MAFSIGIPPNNNCGPIGGGGTIRTPSGRLDGYYENFRNWANAIGDEVWMGEFFTSASESFVELALSMAADSSQPFAGFNFELEPMEIERPESIEIPAFDISLPNAPRSQINANIPTFSLQLPNGDLNLPSRPRLTAVMPVLATHTPPSDVGGTLPVAPNIGSISYPTEPTIDMPLPPELSLLAFPVAPTFIGDRAFNAEIPLPPDIFDLATFDYSQSHFDHHLIAGLETKLQAFLGDEPLGMSNLVWDAIWQRGADKEDLADFQARKLAMREFGSRGFELPPGALVARTSEIIQKNRAAKAELNREQVVKQAEIEVEQVRFGITNTIEWEKTLIQEHSQYEQRKLEAAKAVVEMGIALLSAKVSLYNAEVVMFNMQLEVYKNLIEADKLKLESYRIQVDSQRIITEADKNRASVYAEMVKAVVSQYDIYKAQLERSRVELGMKELTINQYEAEMKGYETIATVGKTNADIYRAKIEADRTQVNVFEAKVSAYGQQVNAYRSLVDALAKEKEVEISVTRAQVDHYRASVDGASADIQGQVAQLDAEIRAFEAQIGGLKITGDLKLNETTAIVEKYKADIDAYTAETGAGVSYARAQADVLATNQKILTDQEITIRQIKGQLASSAMSVFNVSKSESARLSNTDSASVSRGESESKACNSSDSVSYSTSHIYTHPDD